jgi:hypothetical protein
VPSPPRGIHTPWRPHSAPLVVIDRLPIERALFLPGAAAHAHGPLWEAQLGGLPLLFVQIKSRPVSYIMPHRKRVGSPVLSPPPGDPRALEAQDLLKTARLCAWTYGHDGTALQGWSWAAEPITVGGVRVLVAQREQNDHMIRIAIRGTAFRDFVSGLDELRSYLEPNQPESPGPTHASACDGLGNLLSDVSCWLTPLHELADETDLTPRAHKV